MKKYWYNWKHKTIEILLAVMVIMVGITWLMLLDWARDLGF